MKFLWTLALAVALSACGGDSGGVATAGVVGEWKVDTDHLRPKMQEMMMAEMAKNGMDLSALPAEMRETAESEMLKGLDQAIEGMSKMHVHLKADGTYEAMTPADGPGLERQTGKWTEADGGYRFLSDKGKDDGARARLVDGALMVKPDDKEVDMEFRFVRK